MNFFQKPSPLEVAERQLAEARRDALRCAEHLEFYFHLDAMYRARCERLADTVNDLRNNE